MVQQAGGGLRCADLRCAKCGGATLFKEEDVLDVWFDSGSCRRRCSARGGTELAGDAYLEAVEQARGWFVVIGLRVRSAAARRSRRFQPRPHGGREGSQMSKSLGQLGGAVDAAGRMGADVLRLVYASLDYRLRLRLGLQLHAVAESMKIRTTCRFVLGNLADFDRRAMRFG